MVIQQGISKSNSTLLLMTHVNDLARIKRNIFSGSNFYDFTTPSDEDITDFATSFKRDSQASGTVTIFMHLQNSLFKL